VILNWSLFDVRQFQDDFRFFWLLLAGSITALLDGSFSKGLMESGADTTAL
jgi:hypothetical protein